MVWGHFGGAHLRAFVYEELRKHAPMQRGAHFAIFDVPCGAPCWAQRARQKRYEINDFFDDFPNEGHTGSGHQMYPEEQQMQNKSRK